MINGTVEARLCEPRHVRTSGRSRVASNDSRLTELLRVANPRSVASGGQRAALNIDGVRKSEGAPGATVRISSFLGHLAFVIRHSQCGYLWLRFLYV